MMHTLPNDVCVRGTSVAPLYALVTGCAGFVGSHMARQLQREGIRVLGIDNFCTGDASNLPSGIDFVRGDIGDVALLDALFIRYRIIRVFHCAAFASEGLSHYARELCYRTNILGTAALINASVRSRTVRLFCFISSVAVYGLNTRGAVEGQSPTPVDPYGISKLASELDLRAANKQFGLPFLILRLHNLYGPGQNLRDKFRNVIGIFIRNALLDLDFPVFGDGSQIRQFTFIDDIVPLIIELSERPDVRDEVVNMGSDEAISINSLTSMISKLTNRPIMRRQFDVRNEASHCEVSHLRLAQILGREQAFTPLQHGLLRTLSWARTVRDLSLRECYDMEIADLPEAWKVPAKESAKESDLYNF